MGVPAGWTVEEDEPANLPAGWSVDEATAPPPAPTQQQRIEPSRADRIKQALAIVFGSATGNPAAAAQLLDDETKDDFVLGLIRGGSLNSAPLVSRMSARAQGMNEQRGDEPFTQAEDRSPIAHGIGRAIGGLPAAAVLTPAAASIGGLAEGALGAGSLATIEGFLGSERGAGARTNAGEFSPDNVGGKALDAASQGMLAVPMQLAGSVAPEIAQRLKGLPRKGIDALQRWLDVPQPTQAGAKASATGVDALGDIAQQAAPSRTDELGEQIATPPSPVHDSNPPASPEEVGAVEKARPDFGDDTANMKYVDSAIDNAGKGDLPPSKDPEFLRKSQELADMLAADPDGTKVNASIYPGPRGPNIKHKGAYRGRGARLPEDVAGWEREPHAWKAGPDDSEPGDVMDLLMSDHEGPDTQAAMEALNRFERNASRWRNPTDVDTSAGRFPEPMSVDDFSAELGPKTNAGGGGSMYEPMGLPAAKTAEADTVVNDRYSPEYRALLKRMGLNNEGQPFYKPDEIDDIMRDVNAQGAQNLSEAPMQRTIRDAKPIEVPGVNDADAKQQAIAPWDVSSERGAEQLFDFGPEMGGGRDRLRNAAGKVGGVAAKALTAKAGMGTMGPVGAVLGWSDAAGNAGERAGKALFDKLSPEKAAAQLVSDPTLLTQLEQQGGELGRAAAFVMQGAREGGEQGLKARAYILAMQPAFRDWVQKQDAR